MEEKTTAPPHSNYQLRAPADGELYMTSTEAQNGFGRVLDTVARNTTVLITRHNAAQAVVMSYDRYKELTRRESPSLRSLTDEFDALLESMQTEEARQGLDAAFWATPEELSQASIEAARDAKT